jgi:hypothetical protein
MQELLLLALLLLVAVLPLLLLCGWSLLRLVKGEQG